MDKTEDEQREARITRLSAVAEHWPGCARNGESCMSCVD
jgi:hypothetical protein